MKLPTLPNTVLAVILAFFTIGGGQVASAGEAESDFKWFSGLGFPDVKERPFVRVATGQWIQSANNPPQARYTAAFLLAEDEPAFRVLSLDLSDTRLTKSPPDTKEHERVGFEPLELKGYVEAQLKVLRKEPDAEDRWRRFGERLAQRSEVFVVAWSCWRNGLTNEAAELYAEAVKLPARFQREQGDADFRTSVERDLAHALMWRAVGSFGNPQVPRRELLKLFETIERSYVRSEHHARAKAAAATLRRMIAEDEAHQLIAEVALAKLPAAAQVKEWIFRLRDQNGHQWSQPGSCDIFGGFGFGDNKGTTPAHQLARLGHAAVPQLIAALDDPTFSRSVGYHRDFYFSHTVLTVGDCALQILERIAARSFSERRTTSSYLSKDGDLAATRRAAEAWWNSIGNNGERQVLVEAVAAGGPEAPRQARLLAERYPTALSDAVLIGAKASTNAHTRSELIQALGTNSSPAILAFLRDEMVNGRFQHTRVTAALALRGRNEPDTWPHLVAEWQRVGTLTASEAPASDTLVYALLAENSEEAVAVLARDLDRRPITVRARVIESASNKLGVRANPRAKPLAETTVAALEKLLVDRLEDTEERVGLSMGRKGRQLASPSIGDLAAWFLSEAWPQDYHFDIGAAFHERETKRLACLNAWRRKQGQPEREAGQPQRAKLPPEAAAQLVAVHWATNQAAPPDRLRQILSKAVNQRLEPERFVELLAAVAEALSPEDGVALKLVKPGDLTGLDLFARMVPGYPSADQTAMHTPNMVRVGDRVITGGGGVGQAAHYARPEGWQSLSSYLKAAFSAAPETHFEISVSMIREFQRPASKGLR